MTYGPPRIEGRDAVEGKDVPGLYFGATKMTKFFDVVDEVVKETGGTATLFVKVGDDFVRVTTNVKKDGGARAIGTILDPNGPAIARIKKGEAYYGEAIILGKPYMTGYEPLRDASNNVLHLLCRLCVELEAALNLATPGGSRAPVLSRV